MTRSFLVSCGLGVNRALRALGLRISRYPVPADRRLARLLQARAIDMVVDVGANTGQYGEHLRELGYKGRIHSFEPQPAAFGALASRAARDGNWTATCKAVSTQASPIRMNVAANSVSSSLLTMASRHVQAAPDSSTVAEIVVEALPLAEILQPLSGRRVMVKIDTQGYERQVLESAAGTLAQVEMIELEMSLVELYAGQALFRELDAYLTARGFELASLEEGFFDERSGELLQIDGIYTRRH